MDIVMVSRDRPELLEQTIRSMRENAADWSRHQLVVVFDGAGEELVGNPLFSIMDRYYASTEGRESRIYPMSTGKQLGVGGAKNFGARWFSKGLSGDARRGNHLLMFSDGDMWYGPGWDTRLETAFAGTSTARIVQLGGWRHPFHALGFRVDKLDPQIGRTYEVDAATGNCFVIRWSDWLLYGPFDANAIGPGQSEDYALSQRIKAGGGIVATLDPPVAIHCGLVNSSGEPATGWREMEEQITGQLAALPEAMRDDVLILRPAPDAAKLRQMGMEQSKQEQLGQLGEMHITELGTWDLGDVQDAALAKAAMWPSTTKGTSGFDEYQQARAERFANRLNAAAVEMGMMEPSPQMLRADVVVGPRALAVNAGSGQRRFESTIKVEWVNVDLVSRSPDQVPDLVADARELHRHFDMGTVDYVVSHHLHEHLGHGEADPITRSAYVVLKHGGSLIVFTPDARKLAGRWLGGELDDFQFAVQMMGAYQGLESDRHRWLYTQRTLAESLANAAPWREVKAFDWRKISGMDAARDFYIAAVECVK